MKKNVYHFKSPMTSFGSSTHPKQPNLSWHWLRSCFSAGKHGSCLGYVQKSCCMKNIFPFIFHVLALPSSLKTHNCFPTNDMFKWWTPLGPLTSHLSHSASSSWTCPSTTWGSGTEFSVYQLYLCFPCLSLKPFQWSYHFPPVPSILSIFTPVFSLIFFNTVISSFLELSQPMCRLPLWHPDNFILLELQIMDQTASALGAGGITHPILYPSRHLARCHEHSRCSTVFVEWIWNYDILGSIHTVDSGWSSWNCNKDTETPTDSWVFCV